jgi:hypothetical protein
MTSCACVPHATAGFRCPSRGMPLFLRSPFKKISFTGHRRPPSRTQDSLGVELELRKTVPAGRIGRRFERRRGRPLGYLRLTDAACAADCAEMLHRLAPTSPFPLKARFRHQPGIESTRFRMSRDLRAHRLPTRHSRSHLGRLPLAEGSPADIDKRAANPKLWSSVLCVECARKRLERFRRPVFRVTPVLENQTGFAQRGAAEASLAVAVRRCLEFPEPSDAPSRCWVSGRSDLVCETLSRDEYVRNAGHSLRSLCPPFFLG